MPDVPLPPEPVITRWGTWLNAAMFYADHFETFKNVVENLDDDAISVGKLKSLVNNNVVKCGLAFLKLHLSELTTKLTNLEESKSQLLNSLSIFSEIENILINIPGPHGKIIKDKFTYVLDKNDGFKTIKTYSEVMAGNLNVHLDINITPSYLNCFKYAPITSVDVERSFSLYKYILSNRRYNFKEHNLEMYIIINFNSEK